MYRNQKEFDRWGRFYFDNDSGGSGGVEQSFQKALDKRNNDGVALARELYDDNYNLRKKNRELSDEATQLRGKVPAEGAVMLSADEATAWQAYKALGTHEEVKTAIEQRTQLQGQLDALQREAALRDAAAAAGYKFSVLQDRDKVARIDGKELSYAVKEVEKDGTKSRVAFVKDGDTEKPLTEYAQEQWGEFLPSLQAQGSQQQNGTPFPSQHSGTGGNPKPPNLVAQFQQEQAEKAKAVKNPLLKN